MPRSTDVGADTIPYSRIGRRIGMERRIPGPRVMLDTTRISSVSGLATAASRIKVGMRVVLSTMRIPQRGMLGKALTDADQGRLLTLGMLHGPLITVREKTSVVLSDQYGMFSTLELSCTEQGTLEAAAAAATEHMEQQLLVAHKPCKALSMRDTCWQVLHAEKQTCAGVLKRTSCCCCSTQLCRSFAPIKHVAAGCVLEDTVQSVLDRTA